MYVRQPSGIKPNIKIPENYNGHAFSNPPSYSDMPPPIRQVPPSHNFHQDYDLPIEEDHSTAEDMPPSSLSEQPKSSEPPYAEKMSQDPLPSPQVATAPTNKQENSSKNSLFTTLLPPIGNGSNRFPFGHGIGSEELLILAMMLLVYLSDANDGVGDHELLLLLGLLLFAG